MQSMSFLTKLFFSIANVVAMKFEKFRNKGWSKVINSDQISYKIHVWHTITNTLKNQWLTLSPFILLHKIKTPHAKSGYCDLLHVLYTLFITVQSFLNFEHIYYLYMLLNNWKITPKKCITRAMQSVAYPLAYKFDPVTLTFDLWPWKSIGF